MNINKKRNYDLSIIIACYNEEPHLKDSVNEITEVMKRTNYSYEMVFIDDCSQDNTRDIIERICKGQDNYRYYFHDENVGRGGTVKEGLLKARGKYAGFLDVDLEVHARYIPSMIRALEEGADLATASRIYDILKTGGSIRSILSIGYRWIVRIYLKVKLVDTETGYKFFKKTTMNDIIRKTKDNFWFWDTEVMALSYYSNKKIEEIPCLFLRQKGKQSTVKLFRDVVRYLISLRDFKRNYQKKYCERFNI